MEDKKISEFPTVDIESMGSDDEVVLIGSYMKSGSSWRTGLFSADSFVKHYGGGLGDIPYYSGEFYSDMTFLINAEGTSEYNYYRANAGIIPVMLGESPEISAPIYKLWMLGSGAEYHDGNVGWISFDNALETGIFNLPPRRSSATFGSNNGLVAILGDNEDSVYRVNAQDYLREFVDANAEYIYQAISPYFPT